MRRSFPNLGGPPSPKNPPMPHVPDAHVRVRKPVVGRPRNFPRMQPPASVTSAALGSGMDGALGGLADQLHPLGAK